VQVGGGAAAFGQGLLGTLGSLERVPHIGILREFVADHETEILQTVAEFTPVSVDDSRIPQTWSTHPGGSLPARRQGTPESRVDHRVLSSRPAVRTWITAMMVIDVIILTIVILWITTR
jgi:hypothetical protein